MQLHFHINYHTQWGESLYIVGNIPQLGNGDTENAVEMTLTGPDMWETEINLPAKSVEFD